VAGHYCSTPCEKSTYLITTLNVLAGHILHGVPTEATYEEIIEALENRYGDHHQEIAFHSQMKRITQHVGELL
jgi:hypothetical protein